MSNATTYEPAETCENCNGVSCTDGCDFGRINVRIGTEVVLDLDFVDADTDEAVELPSFYFSLFDFDTSTNGAPESLCVDTDQGLYLSGVF